MHDRWLISERALVDILPPLSSGLPYQTLLALCSPQAPDRVEVCLLMCRRPLCRRLSLPESSQQKRGCEAKHKSRDMFLVLWLLSERRCKQPDRMQQSGLFLNVELNFAKWLHLYSFLLSQLSMKYKSFLQQNKTCLEPRGTTRALLGDV